jgi:carbamoyl-phosphate synthase large subunit
MALSARYGQQAASLLRQRCLVESRSAVSTLRAFSTHIPSRSAASCLRLKQQTLSPWRSHQLRLFSSSLNRLAAEAQSAPSAHSYLASGAINRATDLVEVKKVLVIGSGGLSIGQAGEFDYSGT